MFTLKRLYPRPSKHLLSRVFLPLIFFPGCLFSSAGPLLWVWGHTGWYVRVAQGFLPATCLGVTSNSVGGPRAGVDGNQASRCSIPLSYCSKFLAPGGSLPGLGFGKYAGYICTILSLVHLLILGGLYNESVRSIEPGITEQTQAPGPPGL